MSGGSHNYICYTIENELGGRMRDPELNELIHDICGLAHDLEWEDSGDYGEGAYQETVRKFKKKWFGGCREDRLRRYIDEQVSVTRDELLKMITIKDGEKYGIL